MKFRALPPQSYLLACLDIDQATGSLTWKRRPRDHFATDNVWGTWNSRFAGKPAFHVPRPLGYKTGTIDGVHYLAHRIVWKIITGNDPEEIDHIDGNPANNSPSNLRSVTRTEQLRNMPMRRDNKSGCPGILWDEERGKWRAYISNKLLGRYVTFDEAVFARAQAVLDRPFHPNHGRAA